MRIFSSMSKKFTAAVIAAACLTTCFVGANADSVLMGDVNNDNSVDSLDSLLTLRQSVGIPEIPEYLLPYADMDEDGSVTSMDALMILRKSVDLDIKIDLPYIEFASSMTLNCGDRINFNPKIVPYEPGVTFTYKIDNSLSTDGMGYEVLDVTNTGKIKAFHPGRAKINIYSSNGLHTTCIVTVEDNEFVQTVTVGQEKLSVTTHMMTKNQCYNETKDFTDLKGIFVHSTATPGVMAHTWYYAWNKWGTDAAVHAFLDDNGVYKYLPYEQTGWHAGKYANAHYLDFEICEPGGFSYDFSTNHMIGYDPQANQEYFDKIWRNATVYTAYLCKTFGLTENDVMSHAEGAWAGIATNHGDPNHWFDVHGRTMDEFRSEVGRLLRIGDVSISAPKIVNSPSYAAEYDFFEQNPDVTPFDLCKGWQFEGMRD